MTMPREAVHETPRPRDLPTDSPEYGLGTWPKLKERRRWGAFYRQVLPSAAAHAEVKKLFDYDDNDEAR